MNLMGVYRVITACLFLLKCQLCSGVLVGKVEMGSSHRFLQGDNIILPCRFNGKPIAVFWGTEEDGLFIAWRDYGEPFPMTDNGRIEILEDFSLAIKNVTASDAGRYICEVSDFRGHLIGNQTEVKVAVPPMKPFPLIDLCTPPGLNDSSQCQLRVDNSSTVELSCTANGASAGLTTLHWTHNGSVISSDQMTIPSNADGTEIVTSTITAHPSNIPFICVATLNVTKVVTSTTSVIVKPYRESKASPDVTSTTPPATNHPDVTEDNIKPADNHSRNTIAAVAVSGLILLFAIIAIAFALVCMKKKLPIRSPWLYETCQMEESRQGNPDARSELCVTYVASAGKASIIRMTPKSNDRE